MLQGCAIRFRRSSGAWRGRLAALAIAGVLAGCGSAGPAGHGGPQPAKVAPKPAATANARAGAGTLPTITVAQAAPGAVYLPLWVGVNDGLFHKQGINVKVVTLSGGVTTIGAAMVSGSIQIGSVSCDLANMWNDGNRNIVLIASAVNRLVFQIFAHPGHHIHSVADLRGHTIADVAKGSVTDDAVRVALMQAHVPISAVHFVYLHSIPSIESALVAGKVDAAVLSAPASFKAADSGMRQIADVGKIAFGYPAGEYGVGKSYLRAHRALVQDFINGLAAGVQVTKSDEAVAEAAMQRFTHTSNKTVLGETWKRYAPYLRTNLRVPVQSMGHCMALHGIKAKGFTIANMLDNSLAAAAHA